MGKSLTPEVVTLRYAILSMLFLALSGFEGMMLRSFLLHPEADPEVYHHFYAVLTVHPIVGIYGFAYMAVMGAFLYLVPKLLEKNLFSLRLANINMWVHVAGVLIAWFSAFYFGFASLYTLYWPLPVVRFAPISVMVFGAGLFLIELSVLMFIFNIAATVFQKTETGLTAGMALKKLMMAAFGFDILAKLFASITQRFSKSPVPVNYSTVATGGTDAADPPDQLPVFVVSVMRGSIDAVINGLVLAGASLLLLAFGFYALAGIAINPLIIDPLVYKNIYWWGLDMIADGDVLIWTAGTLYLLAPLLTGQKLYGESTVRYVILADLLVSMGVWSHHLLSDTPQPLFMRLISGQFITWGEFFTMGLTFFVALMTLWRGRPVKMSMPMKFMLAGILGFMLGGAAGLLQANVAFNVILHNTQWVPGFHVHEIILTGLGSIIFAVIYALLPMLTGKELKSKFLSDVHFYFWVIGGIGMAFSMGMAWSEGMLRRTLYPGVDIYFPYMNAAFLFAHLLAIGFGAFLLNLIETYGLDTLIGLFIPIKSKSEQ